MLYFYVDSEENALNGVAHVDFDESRLYRDLKQAKKDERGVVLAVDDEATLAQLIDGLVCSCHGRSILG